MEIIPPGKPDPSFHSLLTSIVGPRPIALVSTVNTRGEVNLAPFSFFNIFSSNPPILIFSPARRVRDGTVKHTLVNAEQTGECVVNVVTEDIMHNASMASAEYPEGVNEFIKAGLTPVPSRKVSPPRVKESPVNLECKVKEIMHLSEAPGSGNLIICEIVLIHVADHILDEDGTVNPSKIRLVGRLGKGWYSRAWGDALLWLEQPGTRLGVGYDAIPEEIRKSPHLSARHIYMLAEHTQGPNHDLILKRKEEVGKITSLQEFIFHLRGLIDKGKVEEAWADIILFFGKNIN